MESISFQCDGVLLDQHGLTKHDLAGIASRLEAARADVLGDAKRWAAGDDIPSQKRPLDAGFMQLPNRLLADYHEHKEVSEVGRIQQVADRLADSVDRVVLLGIGGSYMGTRAIFEALCHPYHNELPRGDRDDRPRIYFEGNNVDNDCMDGLLQLMRCDGPPAKLEDRFAVVVISKSGGTLETAVALRQFLPLLQRACAEDEVETHELLVPITGASGRLRDLADEVGCQDVFNIPDGVGGRYSVFTAVGLLPAAILGVDIVGLLEGAAAMNEHFRAAPASDNVVLQYVGVAHLLEQQGCTTRVLSTWGKRLEALGLWYDQLLSESLGKELQGATPITFVGTRDLHSRGQQHQEGRRDKLITNLLVDEPQSEPLTVGQSKYNQDELNALADKTLPEILSAAIQGTNQAYRQDSRPTAEIRIPRLDAARLGQILQMLMLATVVEGRLIGINPYGQPGVEAYKRNMNAILRGQ